MNWIKNFESIETKKWWTVNSQEQEKFIGNYKFDKIPTSELEDIILLIKQECDKNKQKVSINYGFYDRRRGMRWYDILDPSVCTSIKFVFYNRFQEEKVECSDCGAHGRVSCEECHGKGKTNCNDCYSEGEVDCNECSGGGCDECKNGKVSCEYCDGSGRIDCGDCDGDGEVDCSECDGRGRLDWGKTSPHQELYRKRIWVHKLDDFWWTVVYFGSLRNENKKLFIGDEMEGLKQIINHIFDNHF